MATKIMLKNVRLSYANLFEPRENKNGELRYSTALLIPKDHPQVDELHAAITSEGEEKFGKKWASMAKKAYPMYDADEDGKADDDPIYEGMFYINTSSKRKPQVVDRQVQPILDDSEIWSGCYANVSIAVFSFDVPENKGVSFGLNNVQKVKEGERLGGAPNADEEFEAVDDDDDEFSID
jgi:hypothetical protein